ncbi:hypothetical protein OXX80_003877 [Metschnikowia pulcherrima]
MWVLLVFTSLMLSSVSLAVSPKIFTKNAANWNPYKGQNGSIKEITGIHIKPILSVRSVEGKCDYERSEPSSLEQQLMDIYESGMAVIQQNLKILRSDIDALETLLRHGDVTSPSYENAFDQLDRQIKVHELHYRKCNASVWIVVDDIAAYLQLATTELLHADFEELREKQKAYASVIRFQILSHSLSQVV